MDGVGTGTTAPASAEVFSSWPPLAHIEQLKAELASLRPGERQAMERVEEAERQLEDARAALRARRAAIEQAQAKVDAAASAPVPKGHPRVSGDGAEGPPDPTSWLPDELLAPMFLQLPVVEIFRLRLVCRRWRRVVLMPPVSRRVWAERWPLYAMGALRPRWIRVSTPHGESTSAEDSDSDEGAMSGSSGGEADRESMSGDGDTDVASVAASACGTRLYAGTWGGVVQVWDPRDGTLTRELFGHRSTVSAIREWQGPPRGRQVGTAAAAAVGCSASNQDRCAASGPLLLTGSYDGTIRVWSAVDGVHIHTFDEHACGVSALAVRRDGVVFSGSFDGCVCVWRRNDGVLLRRLRTGDRQKVVGICFGPAHHVTAATEDGALCTWTTDTRSSERHRDESDGSRGEGRGGATTVQGGDGLATLEVHARSSRDSSAGDVELELSGKTTCSGCIVGLATSPNDSIAGEGILWMTTASGKVAWSTPGIPSNRPVERRVSEDDHAFAPLSTNGLPELDHWAWVQALAFNSDGTLLYTGEGMRIRVWSRNAAHGLKASGNDADRGGGGGGSGLGGRQSGVTVPEYSEIASFSCCEEDIEGIVVGADGRVFAWQTSGVWVW